MISLSLTSCSRQQQVVLIVAGSTSVQPYAEILAEEFAHLHPELLVDVQGGGSSAGVTAVNSGTADIGMSSRALKSSEENLWSIEIAKDGLAIIVNPQNPVLNLSLEQVKAVYSGEFKNWSLLGGVDHPIHVITREEGSGTRSAFEELVMGSAFVTPKALVQDSNGVVRQLVAGDPYAVGYISLGLVDQTVKALELDGVAAIVENVLLGSYHLYRPFLFVSLSEPEGPARLYIDYILSPEGQKLLEDEGLIPRWEEVR